MQGIILKGYICKTDVPSRPILYKNGYGKAYREIIQGGAFSRALKSSIPSLTLNHKDIITGSSKLSLVEDNIGLRFRAEVNDPTVIQLARDGKLTGCSFTFKPMRESKSIRNGEDIRTIHELYLYEVSVLTDRKPVHGSIVEIEDVNYSPYKINPRKENVHYQHRLYKMELDRLT